MSKQSGLGDNLYIAGYDVSGDINSLSAIGGGPAALEVTGIDKLAFERIGGLRDGRIEFVSFFNPATDRAHDRLSALPTADELVTYCRGTVLGSPAANLIGKQIDYAPTRADDGALTFAVQAQANGYGLEWCTQLTAGMRTDGSATNGTGVDFGTGSTSFGLQAYLHVFAFTGTSVTVKLQESSDNGVGDAWADVTGGGFTAATGITSQRIETARGQTVERYLRAVTTGTFSNAVFAVSVCRNDTSTTF
ncbi:hypothetical protein OG592_26985 [Streptomyces avidinii]|uniref:hypothetical protein n=1 Tax=Streptomyces avidinii TaxID=1895 RepID=UPI00386BBA63|nr:hypothetical protein OG592_26985 [Streptomyces avidinii]